MIAFAGGCEQAGAGIGSETGTGTRMEREGGEEESLGIHHMRNEAE